MKKSMIFAMFLLLMGVLSFSTAARTCNMATKPSCPGVYCDNGEWECPPIPNGGGGCICPAFCDPTCWKLGGCRDSCTMYLEEWRCVSGDVHYEVSAPWNTPLENYGNPLFLSGGDEDTAYLAVSQCLTEATGVTMDVDCSPQGCSGGRCMLCEFDCGADSQCDGAVPDGGICDENCDPIGECSLGDEECINQMGGYYTAYRVCEDVLGVPTWVNYNCGLCKYCPTANPSCANVPVGEDYCNHCPNSVGCRDDCTQLDFGFCDGSGSCDIVGSESACTFNQQRCVVTQGCVNDPEGSSAGNCDDGIDNDCDNTCDTSGCGAMGPDSGCVPKVVELIVEGVDLVTPGVAGAESNTVVRVQNTGNADSGTYTLFITVYNDSHIVVYSDSESEGGLPSGYLRKRGFTWTPQAPGLYTVNASIRDPFGSLIHYQTKFMSVRGEIREETGTEYPWVVLLLIVILVPLVAYYLRKKKTRKG